MLLVREVAMMQVMERLTDKPDWHIKVFNDEIAEKWKVEALAWPNHDLWRRIANIDFDVDERRLDRLPKEPRNILDSGSVDYVSEACAHPRC